MHITIDHNLFDVQSSEEAMALPNLLSTMALDSYPHGIVTDPIYVRGEYRGPLEDWLGRRSDHEANGYRHLLENGLRRAQGPRNEVKLDEDHEKRPRFYLPGPLQIRVERRTETDWKSRRLTITDAIALLREPVHRVVENRRTETRFVLHLAGATNRAMLEECLQDSKRTQAVGGGSGEIKAWLKELLAGDLTPDKWRRVLRGWVLFDRDAGDQDAREPSGDALKIMELCMEVVDKYGVGLSWICLGRRKLESYVPDHGLETEATDRQKPFVKRVIEWRARNDRKEWAWAVDLKRGLHGDLRPTWSTGLSDADRGAIKNGKQPPQPGMLKAPFDECSAAEIDEMKRGLGDKLGERLRAEGDPPDWALDFATEYDRGPDQVRRPELVQSIFDRM